MNSLVSSTSSLVVNIEFKGVSLTGLLAVPEHAMSAVIFAHGSGSNRFSRRNRFVAEIMNEAGIATSSAALRADKAGAVVSRGGRPDLAQPYLAQVRAPTLLIVVGEDKIVLNFNQQAAERLLAQCRLKIVPGATHLLEQVANLARNWFLHYFPIYESRHDSLICAE